MSKTLENTQVIKKESTLSDILGAPTGESTITQTTPNNLFINNNKEKTSVADLEKEKEAALKKAAEDSTKTKEEKEAEIKLAEEKAAAAKIAAEKIAAEKVAKGKEDVTAVSLASQLTSEEAAKEEEEKKKAGRPAVTKDALLEGIEKRIRGKTFLEVDNDKPLSEYSTDELWEVIELNMEAREEKVKEEIPVAFFDSLPEEFQVAYNYFAQGGQDVQHILKVVTQKVELGNLDPKTEDGQEKIIRNYLSYTKYGTPDEIEEEVSSIKDRQELEKKANQFKPKLDAAQEEIIARNIKAQESNRKRAEKESANYMDSVIKALEPGVIAGIKIDKKEKTEFYNALVNPTHQSFTGRSVNEFGYLIEQKQIGPDKDLEAIFMARWILKDKEDFLQRVREQGGSEKAKQVALKLKTEEATKNSAVHTEDEVDAAGRPIKKLQRKGVNNIFK